jgi:hypothetical protein
MYLRLVMLDAGFPAVNGARASRLAAAEGPHRDAVDDHGVEVELAGPLQGREQIGSGPTEATCKTLTARLKGSRMRWDADNAEAVMALEALTQSGQWDLYWQSHLRPMG